MSEAEQSTSSVFSVAFAQSLFAAFIALALLRMHGSLVRFYQWFTDDKNGAGKFEMS